MILTQGESFHITSHLNVQTKSTKQVPIRAIFQEMGFSQKFEGPRMEGGQPPPWEKKEGWQRKRVVRRWRLGSKEKGSKRNVSKWLHDELGEICSG